MEIVKVFNQEELENELKKNNSIIEIHGNGYFDIKGSSTVRAYGSSTVTAYDSSTVTAYGSSTVTAYDSSTVTAYGSSTVRAYDSSTVRAYDSSTVRASQYVSIINHGNNTKISGENIIQLPKLDTPLKWCEFYDVKVQNGVATIFKALDNGFKSNRGFDYSPKTIPVAPDWDGGERECGKGLHFSPRPFMALKFFNNATKFVACPVLLDEIAVHPDGNYPEKVKAKGCCGPVYECDIDGKRIKNGN